MTVLLTRKAVLQAKIEDTYDVAVDVGQNDGFLVSNPLFTVRPNVLERNFVRQDLSPMPVIIGRKIASMTFETELRGNGTQNSGFAANAPMIARLFRACGYALGEHPTQSALGPYVVGDPPVDVAWSVPSATAATQVYTATANFGDGDRIGVGGQLYTFKSVLTPAANEVKLGADLATSLANLKLAINAGAGAGSVYATATQKNRYFTATNTGTTLTVTHIVLGTVGNGRPVSYTASGSSAGTWGGATSSGGTSIASNTDVVAYYLTVDTGGVSGAAKITVTSDTQGEGSASATVTSGSPFSLGTKGLTITPTWTGALAQGQQWVLWLLPTGLSLSPVSDDFESLTIVMHKDGVKHVMPGSYGTFEITAQAGNFATVKWTFTGTYTAPVDDANPTPVFERTLPSQVQLARLTVNQFKAIVDKFTFNQGNDIQIRPDVSSSDGYIGVRITNRKPEGGIDPEADLVANQDFWGNMASALRMPFQMRVGNQAGNTVWVFAPNTQYSGMTYTDRNGILAYDAGLRFARSVGNDEFMLFFA